MVRSSAELSGDNASGCISFRQGKICRNYTMDSRQCLSIYEHKKTAKFEQRKQEDRV